MLYSSGTIISPRDGWKYKGMDRRMDRYINKRVDEQLDEWAEVWVDEWMDWCRKEGWMDARGDGWRDR